MKKRMMILLAGVLVLSLLSACGGKENEEKDRLGRIQEAGEIVIAMEGTWSPWTYHDDSGELVGFDTEVGQAIAEKLGVKATFVEGGWDGLLAGLESGRYDLMINGVNVTEDRAEVYDFSEPYAYDRMAVIVRGDDDRIQSMEDLDGMTTANTITSIYAAKAQEYGANVTGVDDLA
ncbi:MAG: transporter substrate-binding domain-containing protein [Oscillospiraceae bacterium]|nr:transporter substrate-binding domain-containing protein [Oscillospiraceae bacterium]